jgi:putative acetyltransferase
MLKRTDSNNPDFRKLVHELDAELAIRNGDANDYFVQFNKVDLIKHVVVFYVNGKVVACAVR